MCGRINNLTAQAQLGKKFVMGSDDGTGSLFVGRISERARQKDVEVCYILSS
jgi:hypothetical protein